MMPAQRRYEMVFGLWSIQGMLALAWLLILPTDSGGYSIFRLGLFGLGGLLVLWPAWLLYQTRLGRIAIFSPHSFLYKFSYILALFVMLAAPLAIIFLRLLGQLESFTYTAYAERLAPLAFWFFLAGLEWLALQIHLQKPGLRAGVRRWSKVFWLFLAIAMVMIALMQMTGWGMNRIRDGSYGYPTTPHLEWQIGLAIGLGGLALLIQARWQGKWLDRALFWGCYLATCLLWLNTPLNPGFFATPPRAPNFEPYPFSDALIYAQYAQSALVGDGFLWPDIPTRAFYVGLLTWMHALVGQDYQKVIALQTLLLAFFPAALYLLGREMGSRPLGLMLALLATLRDLTTNHAAGFALNYSYSKLFFSELPTALVLVLFCILALRWLKNPQPAWFALLIGGVLGLAALIRLQSAVLWAPLVLVAGVQMWRSRRAEWMRGSLLALVGVMLMLAPWLVRNYYAAGGLVLDNPISQSMVLARRWSGDNGNAGIPRLAGETTAQYTSRLSGMALDQLRQHPDRILNGAASHFFNNLVCSLLILPSRDVVLSLNELVWPEHAFWQTGTPAPSLILGYLGLFCLGLVAAWRFQGWPGLLPFALSLAYHAWTALFLSSGDRFLLPIDWTWCLYYAWALLLIVQYLLSGLTVFQQPVELPEAGSLPQPGRWALPGVVAAILLVGASLPLTERVFPQQYPPLSDAALLSRSGIQLLPGEQIFYGRAIYPRYYQAGDGEPGTAKLGYGVSPDSRLVFWLVGPQPGLVIFQSEKSPESFAHTTSVWVAGIWDGNVLYARIVKPIP